MSVCDEGLSVCMCVCSGVCVHVFYWCCIVNRLLKSNRKPRLVAVVAVMGRVDGDGEEERGAVFRSL